MQLHVFCMFLVGYHQTPEPVIPLVDWYKLTYLVLTCRKTPINQLTIGLILFRARLLFKLCQALLVCRDHAVSTLTPWSGLLLKQAMPTSVYMVVPIRCTGTEPVLVNDSRLKTICQHWSSARVLCGQVDVIQFPVSYPSKTEFLIFGLPQHLSKLNNPTIRLPNNVTLTCWFCSLYWW